MATNSTIEQGVTAGTAAACWSCATALPAGSHFCPLCGKVQPPGEAGYFSFFGLPRRLNVDLAALEKEFYRLTRRLHPDVYARASAQEQAWSLEQSSVLNDAYRTLKDPILRTRYLLGLEGVQLEEQSASATEAARAGGTEKKQVVPPELLEEVFELNMQLQQLKMGDDDPEMRAELTAQKTNLENKLTAMGAELSGYWNSWDAVSVSGNEAERQKVRDQMVDLLNRRNYIRNLVRDVNEALEK
jgi:molecular chaperone HscB